MSKVFDDHGLWLIDEGGFARCPRCGFEAREDDYTGKPMISNFYPDCGADLRQADEAINELQTAIVDDSEREQDPKNEKRPRVNPAIGISWEDLQKELFMAMDLLHGGVRRL